MVRGTAPVQMPTELFVPPGTNKHFIKENRFVVKYFHKIVTHSPPPSFIRFLFFGVKRPFDKKIGVMKFETPTPHLWFGFSQKICFVY